MTHRASSNLRDSGVLWLGQIRADWKVVPAKSLFSARNERSRADDVHLTPSQQYGVLPQQEYMDISGTKVVLNLAGADNMKHVEPDDFVIHLRSFQGGIEHSRYRGKVSMAYTVLAPRDGVHPAYYRWALKSTTYIQALQSTTDQLRDGQSIKYAQFGTIPLPRPPFDEQRAIADFLNRETSQIDAMVDAQERLVALLQERRIAVISARVTGGLTGHHTRNSDVQWIGEIPSHWLVQRLKNSIESAVSGTWGEEPVDGDEQAVPCVRVADFDRPRLRVRDVVPTLRAVDDKEFSAKSLRRGDLLLEKSGGGEKSPVGFVVLYDSDTPAICSNFIARLRLRDGMDPRYWTYAHAASYATRLTQRSLKQSTGIQNLDQTSYFNEPFPFPPSEEQRQIANHLDGVTSRVDAMIERAQESIALMKERRAAVISAAVTGRIDVRTGIEQVERHLEEATA